MKRNAIFSSAVVCLLAGTASAQWSDDFNRPNGPIGGDWTVLSGQTGIWLIDNNEGTFTASSFDGIRHNSASLPYEQSVTSLDVRHDNTGNSFVALIVGAGGADQLYIKVQSQDGVQGYERLGMYHGVNGSGWGGVGSGFLSLTAPFTEGRLTVWFPDANTVRLDIDTDFNGTPDQTYDADISSIRNLLGTGFGIGGWTGNSHFDNWEVTGGNTCYPDCDGNGILDLFDFLCFTNDFNAGGTYADCDGNGTLDLFDFLCFTNAFNAGCP